MATLTKAPPKAVVIHCVDPRFQKAFAEFIHGNLELAEGEYIPLVIPGSIASIGSGIDLVLPKNYKILREQLEIIFQNYKSHRPRVIIINHEDCKAYEKLAGKVKMFFGVSISDKQKNDLEFAATLIRQIAKRFAPQCDVDLYMACIGPDNEVLFEEILPETTRKIPKMS